MCTRTSTQARSHAQKFFVKIDKRNQSLEEFLADLDLDNLQNHLVFSDLDDDDEEVFESPPIHKEEVLKSLEDSESGNCASNQEGGLGVDIAN